jgi:hypothetical protein
MNTMRAYKITSVFSNYFGGESLASIAVKRLYPEEANELDEQRKS